MATYTELRAYVKNQYELSVKDCWIADVKADFGLTKWIAHNRLHPSARRHPCPAAKRLAIEDALRHFGMIP